MSIKLLLLLATIASATTVQIPEWGVNIDVPAGWVGATTNDSTYTVTNPDATVQYGVTKFGNLAPYESDSAWVSGTALGYRILLEAEPAVIWTMDSVSNTSGLFTYSINYESFYQPTGYVLAGQSRFIAHDGVGYELWIMGDTSELYSNFSPYDSLLSLTSVYSISSANRPNVVMPLLSLQKVARNTWAILGNVDQKNVKVISITGRVYSVQVTESGSACTQIQVDGDPGVVIFQIGAWKGMVRIE